MYFRLKKLEQSWNRLFIRVLGRLMPAAPSEKPDWGARPHRVGIGGRINDYALTLRVPPASSAVHHIEHSAVLATAFGVKVTDVDWRPRIYLSEDEIQRAQNQWNGATSKRILVNISAGRP